MTRPAEYWKKRAEANMDRVQEGAEQRLARLGRAYRQAAQELTDEVKRILGTYAKRFDLTPEEAAAALQEPFDEESRAYGYRVSRAEALKAAIQERMNRLGVQVERETAAQREWTASKSYQSARKMVQDMTGGLVNHATPDLRGMLQAMDTVWAGGNYSARIWKNTERLAETLSSEIEAAFLSGKSVRRMADTIMERFGVGYRAAECLERTETSYVQNWTAARSYEDAGCTEYEVLTAQDRRTCQYCAKQNGKRYLLATMQAGENAPPFHPNCRCTVLPVVEEGTETGKAEAAKQEEIGFAVATTGKSGIIKADRVISGHSTTPKKAEPNVVIDHVDENGSVDARGFYDADGLKERDIHTTDHGNPKWHPYGEHGEHGHDYQWNTDGSLKRKAIRELTDTERKENSDIL